MRGRPAVVVILILVLIGLIAFLIARRPGGLSGLFNREEPGLPVDLVRVIPPEWQVPPGAPPQCNFDDDPDLEWLVSYRYNIASLPRPSGQATEPLTIGPWGAAIFDLQAETLQELSANPGPYRPSEMIPYKLLPDFYPGKGQGYLGETSVEVFYVPNVPPGPTCKAQEINILGYGNAGLPTRISVFKWGGATLGYLSAHLAGNARVEVTPRADSGSSIATVSTFDRIENHRSLLCNVQTHERFGFGFTKNAALGTIDFCYGPPPDPYYPEGVVVALLRNHAPLADAHALPLDGYLFKDAELPDTLKLPPAQPLPIVRLINPSDIHVASSPGGACTAAQMPKATEGEWWCGRERTTVTAEVRTGDDPVEFRRLEFTLASVLPMTRAGDVRWRVERVRLEQP